jgi:hypothetical protein
MDPVLPRAQPLLHSPFPGLALVVFATAFWGKPNNRCIKKYITKPGAAGGFSGAANNGLFTLENTYFHQGWHC